MAAKHLIWLAYRSGPGACHWNWFTDDNFALQALQAEQTVEFALTCWISSEYHVKAISLFDRTSSTNKTEESPFELQKSILAPKRRESLSASWTRYTKTGKFWWKSDNKVWSRTTPKRGKKLCVGPKWGIFFGFLPGRRWSTWKTP